MAKRGKKSAASLAVVQVLPGQRPEPPAELTEAQASVWRAVVQTKPADWFTDDTFPLLAAYCRHVVAARALSEAVDRFDMSLLADEEHIKHYDKLLAMRERETRAVLALARSMRLTQQSRYDAKRASTAATQTQARKPWEA